MHERDTTGNVAAVVIDGDLRKPITGRSLISDCILIAEEILRKEMF